MLLSKYRKTKKIIFKLQEICKSFVIYIVLRICSQLISECFNFPRFIFSVLGTTK